MDLRPVPLSDAMVLRDAVLRPDMPPGGSRYPGDDAAGTLHLGAFLNERLVAVATVCREPMPETSDATAWRLRGMATLPEFRGQGLGRRLADHCRTHAADRGGTLLWCSARVATTSFYRSLGFKERGESFHLPEFSNEAYILMQRPLP